ncbi:MAG TPA: DUF1684 domain-containing protein [Streptosporangiaceae bacterium]|jgi:uncharacterized protein (DUF1684 family)|nr:DUF1684 domain-containing protein [Streptosporangiaceae bacterium]
MSLTLLDWRRRVARLYAEIRAEPDPVAAHEHWRRTRDDLLRTHPDSPIPGPERASYPGAPVAAYDPRLRFDVAVDTGVPPEQLKMATGTDGIVRFDRIGTAHLPGLGDLDVWWLASYGGGVFVPVKDASAGTASYGGGRYLFDTAKGADLGGDDGRLVLDFNFAYNPSCAYDPAWACPLAPAGNTLARPLLAGELMPPDH